MINKFLFLDFECANVLNSEGKICSLGYVLTDRNFNVVKQDDILCNPQAGFIVNNQGEYRYLKLAYSVEDFRKAPAFNEEMYFDLLDLIEEDTLVIGFGFENDLNFLRYTLDRYDLEFINFRYFDVQKFYQEFTNNINKNLLPSLDMLYEQLEKDKFDLCSHKSCDDAFKTMRVLKILVENTDIEFEKITTKYNSGYFYEFLEAYNKNKNKMENYLLDNLKNNKNNFFKHLFFVISTRYNIYYNKLNSRNGELLNYYQIPVDEVLNDIPKMLSLIFEFSKHNYIYSETNKSLNNSNYKELITTVLGTNLKTIKPLSLNNLKYIPYIEKVKRYDRPLYDLTRYACECSNCNTIRNYFSNLEKNIYKKVKKEEN